MKNIIWGTGLSAEKDYKGLFGVCSEAVKSGIMAFDTAPSYGTEEVLGQVMKDICRQNNLRREDIVLQTKIDPVQMLKSKKEIENHIYQTIDKMKTEYLDAVLIHWPWSEEMQKTWSILEQFKHQNIIKKIGICNVKVRQLKAWRNIKPDIVQIERNPLRTCYDEIKICKERSITIQAYSPLCKMHEALKNSSILRELSDKYNKDIGDIILRWHIDTGVIPVFTSKNPTRIRQYANVFDFELELADIDKIYTLNRDYKMYLESWSCPGF